MADRPVSRLQDGDPINREAYDPIIAFFRQFKSEVVQIELLPFYPVPEGYIYTENTSLGIPKSTLYKAFLHARSQFFSTLATHKTSPSSSTIQTLLETSTILLLHDSEYLTAVNTRKRILLSIYPAGSPGPRLPPGAAAAATAGPVVTPDSELNLLTSLLTSPLHRHSKSPILFSYRRWLFTTYSYLLYPGLPPTRRDPAAVSKAFKKWARKEIASLFSAAESHPKNYYAWSYARWLVESMGVSFNHEDLVSWCLKHASDVSGWSFLAWLWVLEYRTHNDHDRQRGGWRREDVLQQRYNQMLLVLKYSHNTAPGHDSLWMFVRAVIGQGVFDENAAVKGQIMEMLRMWDGKEWPTRVADDVIKERVLLRETLKILEGRRPADGDLEMVDRPP